MHLSMNFLNEFDELMYNSKNTFCMKNLNKDKGSSKSMLAWMDELYKMIQPNRKKPQLLSQIFEIRKCNLIKMSIG